MLEEKEIVEKKKFGIGAVTVITVLSVIAVIVGIIALLRMIGKNNLSNPVVISAEAIDVGETDQTLKENQVLYNGQVYERNQDIITILAMGIDTETVNEIGGQSWEMQEGSYNRGGQADGLFLIVINPHEKSASIIAINRNSMVDVDVWDDEGNYKGVYIQQVTLQHGYGDGGEESCLRQVKTVSRMFHNIPINSYAAISMDAIPKLNDAVGGVTVEVLDDIIYPEFDMWMHQGDTVTLHGEKAYWYVRLRNENVFNSNALRLNRQKQYLNAFIAKAKSQIVSDVRVAVDLYNTISDYMVTDINLSSFTYLVTEFSGYSFDVDHIYSLEGETVMGVQFEEFYVDDAALQDLIIRIFYEPAV